METSKYGLVTLQYYDCSVRLLQEKDCDNAPLPLAILWRSDKKNALFLSLMILKLQTKFHHHLLTKSNLKYDIHKKMPFDFITNLYIANY